MRGDNPVHLLAGGDVLDQRLGKLKWVDSRGPGQTQGQAGGEVAVFRFGRPLHQDVGRGVQLQDPVAAGLFQGFLHHLCDSVQD